MRLSIRLALLLVIAAGGCTLPGGSIGGGAPAERLAAGVTITRDEWGVPHISGETDAHAAFGAGYAQAEDGFALLEESYLHALGRASHWYGEEHLAADVVRAVFEVERLAREEYDREPADRRAIWDAFAAGINHWIRTSGERPRLITRFEPWMPFAMVRRIDSATVIDGVRLDTIVSAAGARPGGAAAGRAEPYEWTARVVAPQHTASGHALLLQSTRGEFFGAVQDYEMALSSGTGWSVRGLALLGTPVPHSGHNRSLAWAWLPTGPDAADVYEVTFENADTLAYRFDDERRDAIVWQDTLLVNSGAGVRPHVFTFSRTHHGPVVARAGQRALAVRVARMEEGGALQQWYAMSRAADLTGFRTALDGRALAGVTVYADVQGNIMHVHGGAVPVRDNALDWTRPVDGTTSRTEWRGYHTLDELPQALNPASGMVDAASVPRGEAGTTYPRYLIGELRDAAPRPAPDSAWTLEIWAAAAFDVVIPAAAGAIDELVYEWEQIGGVNPVRARRLDGVIELLRAWDGSASADSEAATLYVLWQERVRAGGMVGEYTRFRAMEDVITRLERDRGSARVSWGDVNRLQRLVPLEPAFHDDSASLPLPGAPVWTDATFTIDATDAGQSRRYAAGGVTAVRAVELAPEIRSRTVVMFGQSGDPASAHFFDQAPLYARGELKWARLAADSGTGARRYRPASAVR